MVIAVNTRLLLRDKLEGIGWYTFEVMKRITQSHPEHRFIFIFDRPYSEEFVFSGNITPVVIGPQARRPILWKWWFDRSVPKILKKYKADLFFSPDGYIPLSAHPCPMISVIHDLNFEHYPQDLPGWATRYYKKNFPLFAKRSDRILTVSEFSKKDIVSLYGADPSKITVAHNGANTSYVPLSDEQATGTRKKYTEGKPYFLYIGSRHPRKNISRLLEAFQRFRASGFDFKMVFVGESLWNDTDKNYGRAAGSGVIFTGRLPVEELKNVLGAAFALTYVPYFEGFGIPVLEAMFAGVPVITANASSLPEVGGDAAIYCDPFSVDSIADAMIRMVKDEKLRSELVRKGNERKKEFSWDKTAVKVWSLMEEMLSEK